MNYERRYNDALARARDMMSYKEVRREDMEYLFPELKESDDDRIRKELTDYIKSKFENSCSPTPSKNILGNWIAWLEKQGKQTDIANKEYWRGYREGKQEILNKYAELEKQGKYKSVE